MVVAFSGNRIMKTSKIVVKIIMLIIILCYILPQLLSLLWYIHDPDPRMREEHLLEKPLRVISVLVDVG